MTAAIELDRFPARYHPGEVVSGTVEWSFAEPPLTAEVSLRWRAEGKGTPDAGEPITEPLADLHAAGRRTFRLGLPVMPYSFSGKVLAIVWRVELVVRSRQARRENVVASCVVTMSPTGESIDPYQR